MNINAQLEAGHFYHICNRGINGETLFKEERNYLYFLTKNALYVSPIVETFAYCLLKNHFHLLIRIKDQTTLDTFYKDNYPLTDKANNQGIYNADFIVSKQFARPFSSFTQATNKSVKRTGSLIETPFKRIEVKSDSYLSQLLAYIHCNPQKHGFVKDFKDYPHSSYHSHLHSKSTKLQRNEVLNWFRDRESYTSFHLMQQYDANISDFIIEFE